MITARWNQTNKFPYLMKFLLNKKNWIEYRMDKMRSTNSIHVGKTHLAEEKFSQTAQSQHKRKWCPIHNTNSHTISECHNFKMLKPPENSNLSPIMSSVGVACVPITTLHRVLLEQNVVLKAAINFITLLYTKPRP